MGGGGAAVVNNNKVLYGEALLGGLTLNLFIKSILIGSNPFYKPSTDKLMGPILQSSLELCMPFNCCKCIVVLTINKSHN